jgi:hypothetical protein
MVDWKKYPTLQTILAANWVPDADHLVVYAESDEELSRAMKRTDPQGYAELAQRIINHYNNQTGLPPAKRFNGDVDEVVKSLNAWNTSGHNPDTLIQSWFKEHLHTGDVPEAVMRQIQDDFHSTADQDSWSEDDVAASCRRIVLDHLML